jgi:(2Fe-2S) ferredoxin
VEPLVEVNVEGVHHVVYARINKQAALGIVEKHLCQKRLMNDHIVAIKQDKAQC